MNQIIAIYPYRLDGQWVFDDGPRGLLAEPFVSGADDIVGRMSDAVYGYQAIRAGDRREFALLFSSSPFPGWQYELKRTREESGGNWYVMEQWGMTGWLCPALFKYFDKAPDRIYVQAKAKGSP